MQDDTKDTNSEEMEAVLCHNCMAKNPVDADFCKECNTPLSTHAAYDPLMQITASGDTYIKATTGRPGWIKTIGIILIFGPVCINGLIGSSNISLDSFTSLTSGLFAGFYLAQVLLGLYVILKVVLRNFTPVQNTDKEA